MAESDELPASKLAPGHRRYAMLLPPAQHLLKEGIQWWWSVCVYGDGFSFGLKPQI